MTRGILKNLEGKVFGHLLVLQRTDNDAQNNAQWFCKCDCGNEVKIRAPFLKKGQICCSRSCIFNPAKVKKDISGQSFGELIAIKEVGVAASRKTIWQFVCSCGVTLDAPSDRVLNGGMKKCGKGIHASSYKHGESATRAYKSARYTEYLADKLQRTPKWLSNDDIEAMNLLYKQSAEITRQTNVQHEVDHYYPLRGKTVSGLHCPLNLRVVTRKINRTKINHNPDDVC